MARAQKLRAISSAEEAQLRQVARLLAEALVEHVETTAPDSRGEASGKATGENGDQAPGGQQR